MIHQAELTWYFSTGQCAFERSLFGGMLDRAAVYAYGSATCQACEGTGHLTDSPQDASGSPRACKACRGRGSTPNARHGRTAPGWAAIAPAVVARGAGISTLTARPRGGARAEPSYVPDDESMRRFARVSRKLRLMTAPQVEVLARYYGDIGSSWVLSPTGRIGSVYPMTVYGRALISDWLRTRPEAETFIRHDEIVRTVSSVNRRSATPDDLVRRKLHKADDEARALLLDAQNNWRALR